MKSQQDANMFTPITTQMSLFNNDMTREQLRSNEIHEEFSKLREQLDDVMTEINSMVWGNAN